VIFSTSNIYVAGITWLNAEFITFFKILLCNYSVIPMDVLVSHCRLFSVLTNGVYGQLPLPLCLNQCQ